MRQQLSIILSLFLAATVLFVPSQYASIVYPLIGILVALILKSILATILIFIMNIVIFFKILERTILITNFNNQLPTLVPTMAVSITESILIIYLIVLLIINIKRNNIKDSFLASVINILRYYKNILEDYSTSFRNQLIYVAILTLLLWILSPHIPPNIIYLYIVSIPLYLFIAPVQDIPLLQVVSSLVFVSSLRYPPLVLLLYYLKDAETIEVIEMLRNREGAELGQAIAALIESPLVRYRDENIRITRRYSYDWAPLITSILYKISIGVHTNPHIVISGASGSGKSYTAARIATQIAKSAKSSVIIIDPHGEYKNLLNDSIVIDASTSSINPLDLHGKSPRQRAIEITSLISSLFKLGPLQERLLEDAILLAYEAKGIIENEPSTWRRTPPTLLDVAQILRRIASREKRAYIVATYVESLASRVFAKTNISIDTIFGSEKPVIIDLSSIGERSWQSLYIELFLEKLYIAMKERDLAKTVRAVLVIDEAHLVASKNSRRNIVANMATELRKYGLALILITQRLDDLDKSILANTGTKIALRQVEPKLAKYVAESIAVSNNRDEIDILTETLGLLPKGYAVVRDYDINTPLMLRIS